MTRVAYLDGAVGFVSFIRSVSCVQNVPRDRRYRNKRNNDQIVIIIMLVKKKKQTSEQPS